MSLLHHHSIIKGAAASTLNNGIVSYWKLDDLAGPAIDSANGNDGTVVGATQGVAGKIGMAYLFNGTGDHVNFGDLSLNGLGAITISVWVYPHTFGQLGGRVFDDRITTGVIAFIGSGNKWSFFVNTATGTFRQETTTNATVTYNEWHHLASIYTGTDIKIYVDADDKPTITNSAGSGNLVNAGDDLLMGDNHASNRAYDGVIDEAGVWNRALTPTEITELYNGGAGLTYPF